MVIDNKTKICSKCNIEQYIWDFYKHIKSKDGIRTYCKACSKKYNKDNREYLYQKEKEYWIVRPEKFKEKAERRKPIENKINFEIERINE